MLIKDERTIKKTRYEKQQEKKIKKLTSAPVKVGDRVKLIGSRQPGEIIEVKKDQFLLAIGALNTWTTREKFIPAESLHGDRGTPKGKARGGVKEPETEEPIKPVVLKSKKETAAEKKKAKKSVKNTQNADKTAQKTAPSERTPTRRPARTARWRRGCPCTTAGAS